MLHSLSRFFKEKILHAEKLCQETMDALDRISTLAPLVAPDSLSDLEQHRQDLQEAMTAFKKRLSHPELILATTGTTSSGKSTLVNMLCGAEIMPVAVQEMTAGTVEIHHHATDRILKIPPVPGLPAEYSGEWSGISDEEIKCRLKQLMDSYRNLREKNEEPPAPTIELHYPTRLGQSEVFSNLFSGDFPIKLCIMDLPGFKHLSDDHNRKVIQEKIKPALWLVTYNSEETDPRKQQRLLEEVVDQVKEMRGTPARMLFILNRIDVFLRDRDPEKHKNEFKKHITEKIRSALEKALPEYSTVIRELQTQELSALPALLACQTMQDMNNSEEYLEKIEINFKTMMPMDLLEELPRNIQKWETEERLQMAEAIWEASYGKNFDQVLEKHIFNNLPDLLLPHVLKPLGDKANAAYTKAHQILRAHTHVLNEIMENLDGELILLRQNSRQQFLRAVRP